MMSSVSVAIEGATIVVGSPQAVGTNNGQGSVDVFVKPSEGWNDGAETAELVSPTLVDDFGVSVAINGIRVVAGTFSSNNAIFVYTRPAKGGWKSTSQPNRKLTNGSDLSFFGFAVAITNDTIVAGAPYQTVKGHVDQGAAYVVSE